MENKYFYKGYWSWFSDLIRLLGRNAVLRVYLCVLHSVNEHVLEVVCALHLRLNLISKFDDAYLCQMLSGVGFSIDNVLVCSMSDNQDTFKNTYDVNCQSTSEL